MDDIDAAEQVCPLRDCWVTLRDRSVTP
jgi:hypothetical protein